jgi:hypothetical protein
MSPEELQKIYDDLRKEGHSEEELLVATGRMFEDGKINLNQLKGICQAEGWELDPDFAKITDEDEARKNLWKSDPQEPAEGLSEGQVKDAELDPDGMSAPSDRGGKPKDEDDDDESTAGNGGDNRDNDKEDDSSSDKADDDDTADDGKNEEEKEKAFRLMGIHK